MIEGLPHVVVWAAVASDKVYVCVTPQPRSDGRRMPDQYFKVRPNPGSWGRVFGAFADTMGVPAGGRANLRMLAELVMPNSRVCHPAGSRHRPSTQ